MHRAYLLLVALGLAAPAEAQREALGVFGRWGAFAEEEAGRCFAIAEPQGSARYGDARPFASVGYWPGKGVRGQVHFRLSREKRPGSAVLLRIDGRTFQLVGGSDNAWAPDRSADADIVAAIRSGLDMTIETRSDRGARLRDHYQLRGAATAIDAAAIACARLR